MRRGYHCPLFYRWRNWQREAHSCKVTVCKWILNSVVLLLTLNYHTGCKVHLQRKNFNCNREVWQLRKMCWYKIGIKKKYLWSPIDYLIQSIYLLCWLLLTKSMNLNVTSMKYRKLNTGGYLDADQENKPWRCQHQRMLRSSEFSTRSDLLLSLPCHSVLCAALSVINSFINNDQ